MLRVWVQSFGKDLDFTFCWRSKLVRIRTQNTKGIVIRNGIPANFMISTERVMCLYYCMVETGIEVFSTLTFGKICLTILPFTYFRSGPQMNSAFLISCMVILFVWGQQNVFCSIFLSSPLICQAKRYGWKTNTAQRWASESKNWGRYAHLKNLTIRQLSRFETLYICLVAGTEITIQSTRTFYD